METPTGNAQLTASIMFDGDNVNLNSPGEDIDGFTLTPDINSTNLPPVLGSNNLIVTEGATVTVTDAMLSGSDADSADAGLMFTVSSVNGGQFELTTELGVEVFSFTQGQILSNEVVFVDDGDETPPSFDVNVSDGTNTTAPNAGVVTFINTNDAPVAVDDSVTATEDTVLTSTIDLDANDTDLDGDALSVVAGSFATARGGSITIAADGSYGYTPAANFNGVDSVDYTVTDGSLSDVGTLTINVTAVNDAPVAVDDAVTTAEDTVFNSVIDLDANDTDLDGDALSVVAGTYATTQGGSITLAADGSCSYTPAANFNGVDSVDYTVTDGSLSDVGTLTITVTAVNTAPTSMDSMTSTNEDQARTFTAADFPFADVESASIVALRIDALPTNGVLMNGATAITVGDVVTVADLVNFSFTPTADFNGTDSFTFSVYDGMDFSAAPNTMTIAVNAVNDIPTSGDFSITTMEDLARTFAVSDFPFADAEINGIVALRVDAVPANGILMNGTTVLSAGDVVMADDLDQLSYTPNAGFNGSDSFGFSVSDGTAYSSAPSIVTASVTPAPAVPAPVVAALADPIVVVRPDLPVINTVADPVVAETTVEEAETVTEAVTDDEPTSQDEPAQAAEAPGILVPPDGLGAPQAAAAIPDHDSGHRVSVDSAVKVNLQGLMQAIKIQLPGWDNLLMDAGGMFDPMNLLESNDYNRDMDQLREEVAEDESSRKMKAGTGVVLTTSLTVGYVAYLVRGGVLLSSVLSTLPVWNFIDPTPILASLKSGDDDDSDADESLESLVTQEEQSPEVENEKVNAEDEG